MNSNLASIFGGPVVISLISLVVVWHFFGLTALILTLILCILEITLSFDNAVVNAKILARMSHKWQRRFLTWGIAIAVFGTRFLLPIIIVSVAVMKSPIFITHLAITDPKTYGQLLEGVHGSITAFGGAFLLMVSLKYFFNRAKEIHWIEVIERHLVKWGRIEAIEIALALTLLTTISYFSPYDQASVIVSGIVGIVLFILMEGISGSLSVETEGIARNGLSLFIYLNVLDSAFSLDGVIGAFALTTNLVIIVVGLGVGAYFVRAFTVYFVERKTLTELVYLEHGAHWAIFGLSIAMLANLVVHVPEVVTGVIGLIFVIFSYRSSLRMMKRKA